MTKPGADDELSELFIGADTVLDGPPAEPAGPAGDTTGVATGVATGGVSPDR